MAQLVKNPPAIWETWVRSLGWEDALEKGKATHSSILAWRIPWTIIYSLWGRKELDTTDRLLHTYTHYNEQPKNEIRKAIIHNSIERTKYYQKKKKNLTKEEQDLHTKNYETLLKNRSHLNKWKDSPCS